MNNLPAFFKQLLSLRAMSASNLWLPTSMTVSALVAMAANVVTPPSLAANPRICVKMPNSSSLGGLSISEGRPAATNNSTKEASVKAASASGVLEYRAEDKGGNLSLTSSADSLSHQQPSENNEGMRGRPTLFGDRMVTVSFRIPNSYASRIEEHSKKAKESKSDFFRRAIDLALQSINAIEEQSSAMGQERSDNAE